MKNEIIIDGITYVRKEHTEKKIRRVKDIFETTSIEEIFEFAAEDLDTFKLKYAHLPVRKLNQELIEKSCEILNQGWKPTKENTWYTPYFNRLKSGLVFGGDYCWDNGYTTDFPSSLALKDQQTARHSGTILLPQYEKMILPQD